MNDNSSRQDAIKEDVGIQVFDSVIAPLGIRLSLNDAVQVWSGGGHRIELKARRARAVLCLIALSGTLSISRQLVVATLWSNLDRVTGMARLRSTLHNLIKTLEAAGTNCVYCEGNVISFRPELISIEIADLRPDSNLISNTQTRFLEDLEGIDTSLDRWLDRIRAERNRTSRQDRLSEPSPLTHSIVNNADRGPSLVILPFQTAGSPIKGRLAAALSDEIGVCLARLRWLTVLTTAIDGALPVTAGDFAKLADYAFVGTLQRDVTLYKLSVKVIDLQRGGAIVWAASFEQPDQDSFSLQRKLSRLVAANLDSGLLLAEAHREQNQRSSTRGTACSLVLRAIPAIFWLEREAFVSAGHLLEEAVALHRDFSMAHCWLALWHIFLVGQGWASKPHRSLQRADEAAGRAVMLDARDARAVSVAGHVKAFLHRRPEEADVLHERALQLNPALPLAWFYRGVTYLYSGHLDEAQRCFETGQQLAPDDPQALLALNGTAIVHLLQHNHEDAAFIGRRVVQLNPNFTSGYKTYLSALGHLGEKTQALAVLNRFRLLEPGFSMRTFNARAPYQRAKDLEHFAQGLRRAGVT